MIKVDKLNNINEDDIRNILKVWESSVIATHDFLSEEDIVSLIPNVVEGDNYVNDILCVKNDKGIIKAFNGVYNNKIEMLFVSNDYRGMGIGKKLIKYAIKILNVNYVDVNEQNLQAVGFYKYIGFEVFKRSDLDEQGKPFPIFHMKLN